jgi:hypothetical protein
MSRPEEWVDTKGNQRVDDHRTFVEAYSDPRMRELIARCKQHVPEYRHAGSVTNPADAVDFYIFITEYYRDLRDETTMDELLLLACRDAALRLMAKYRTVNFNGKKFSDLSKNLRDRAKNSTIDVKIDSDDE